MLLERLFPSMFQRRLLLLLGLVFFSLVVLGAKLGHLTVVKAEGLRDQAESRLSRSVWTQTSRGRILDRKGRVLARDRASYAVGLDYSVIAGDWATDRARVFVRRTSRAEWLDMSEAERARLLTQAQTAYERHLSRGLDELSRACGLSRVELDEKIAAVRNQVEGMARAIAEANVERELRQARERDEVVTPELLRDIERRTNQPIREMKLAQRVLPRVSDTIAFELQYIEGDAVTIAPLGEESGKGSDSVPCIPGLKVFDTGDREYPLDTVTVELDARTFPADLRSESVRSISVEGVASHLVGWMRDRVFKEDNDNRRSFLSTDAALRDESLVSTASGSIIDRGEYRDGDRVGEAGIENGAENVLRGLRGRITRHIDTGEVEQSEARPGRDVTLTVDAMVQARVQAAMHPEAGLARVQPWHRGSTDPVNPTMPDGTPITGAAVVLDIDTGQILAMVSTPEISRQAERETPAVLDDPVEMPRINRAIGRGYPPGSIVKPLILAGAITRGNFSLDQSIACTGHLFPNNEYIYRCWIFKRSQNSGRLTHSGTLGHDPGGAEAIMVSCNVFFYTLGRRLGPEGIRSVYEDFGVGTPFDLNIGEEHRGTLGAWKEKTGPDGKLVGGMAIEIGDAIFMGMGQGPVTWTPLHAANAYATLARYGARVAPSIVIDRRNHAGPSIHLDSGGVAMALDGLHRSANLEEGTGHHLSLESGHEPIFNAPTVEVWGKTGTADAPRIFDPDVKRPPSNDPAREESDGVNPSNPLEPASPPGLLRSGDHSWFVVLAGPKGDRPRYAISVVMDYAGSGGKVSGPIANQIIHALIAEGYL